MTVSELPGRTALLAHNVAANVPATCSETLGSFPITVRECVWGEVGSTTAWGKVEDMGQDWDYITGTDLVYSDDSTPALVSALSFHL